MSELFTALLVLFGALIGGLIAFFGEFMYRRRVEKSKQQHSASILYYDLKSIQAYTLDDLIDVVDVRYTPEWQRYVANCIFLRNHEVALIYEIYNRVYNYNHGADFFRDTGMPDKPYMLKKLAEKINHQDFKELLDMLKAKVES